MSNLFKSDDCTPLTAAVQRGEVNLVAVSRGQYPGKRLSQGSLPALRSIGYWDAVGPQSWGLPMHRNEGIEICYVLSGQTSFATDTGDWMLRAGDITITRPWQRHRLGDPHVAACKLFWIILDVESNELRTRWEFPEWIGSDRDSRRQLLRIFHQNQRCHLEDKDGQLGIFLKQTLKKFHEDGPLAIARLANAINHLLLCVAEALSEGIDSNGKDPQGFNQTVNHFFKGLETSIEKAAEPWTIDTMAHVCRVGKSLLTVTCRDLFNTTPSDQLNLIRLFHASNLLKSAPARSVTEIAFFVGFNSSQYFANRFKKQFGMTPMEHRAKAVG